MEITVTPAMRESIFSQFPDFWGENGMPIRNLKIPMGDFREAMSLPPQLIRIKLPEWAGEYDCGGIPVPVEMAKSGTEWDKIDWISVIAWFLYLLPETMFETKYGEICSYSSRLCNWDPVVWEKAWVNRIALFLRKFAEHENGTLLPKLPEGKIVITHDIDALSITPVIRMKQTVFQLFNFWRALLHLDFAMMAERFHRMMIFLLRRESLDYLGECADLERRFGVFSIFHIYVAGGTGAKGLRSLLIDPGYKITRSLKDQIGSLRREGWNFGIHLSFSAGIEKETVVREAKEFRERFPDIPLYFSRNHWLHFSLLHSWENLAAAGVRCDSTLGFNDRPGFRNGAALCYSPWDYRNDRLMEGIREIPLIMMDSQFYDYSDGEISYADYLDEILRTHGSGTILWHPHTLGRVYNWRNKYEEILTMLFGKNHERQYK